MAIVIYTENEGIFLGTCMGMGFWSKLEPAGQDCAATFADQGEAEAFMQTWHSGRPEGVQFVQVTVDVDGTFASIDACVQAGLPAWELNPPCDEPMSAPTMVH